jgi:hypothetical protein
MIRGHVTNIGTMEVDGETQTGIFVEVTRADLKDQGLNLFCKDVEIKVIEK